MGGEEPDKKTDERLDEQVDAPRLVNRIEQESEHEATRRSGEPSVPDTQPCHEEQYDIRIGAEHLKAPQHEPLDEENYCAEDQLACRLRDAEVREARRRCQNIRKMDVNRRLSAC